MEKTKVEIYSVNMNSVDTDEVMKAYGACFEPKRLESIHNAKSEKRIRELIIAGGLMVRAFREHGIMNAEISYGQYGKPFICNCDNLFFNVSHSGDMVLLALSGSEIGADIQKHVIARSGLLNRICTEDEIAHYEDGDLAVIFSLKEAYTKYLGLGLSKEMKDISFRRENDFFKVVDCQNDSAAAYSIMTESGYEAAFVVGEPVKDIIYKDLFL